MSIPRKQTVACPRCGETFPVTIWDSVNTDLAVDLPEKIINGTFFDVPCPHCGKVAHLQYDVLYHDMRHDTVIWVVHKNSDNWQKRCVEIRSGPLFPGYRSRIVHGINELREKVAALEADKDDRVIELCKYFIAHEAQRQQPDFYVSHVFYTHANGIDIVFLYGQDGKELSCELEPAMYNMIAELFSDRLNEISENSYEIYDFAWAASVFAGDSSSGDKR